MIMTNTVPDGRRQAQPAGQRARPQGAGLRHRPRRRSPTAVGEGVQIADARRSRPTTRGACPRTRTATRTTTSTRPRPRSSRTRRTPAQRSLTFTLVGAADVDTPKIAAAACRASGRRPASTPTSRRSSSTAYIAQGRAAATTRRRSSATTAHPTRTRTTTSGRLDTAKGVRRHQHQLHPVHERRQMEADLATGRTSGYPDIRKKAYDDLVKQLNAGFINIWLYWTPYSLDRRQAGARPAGGHRRSPFGNFQPKTWLGRPLAPVAGGPPRPSPGRQTRLEACRGRGWPRTSGRSWPGTSRRPRSVGVP